MEKRVSGLFVFCFLLIISGFAYFFYSSTKVRYVDLEKVYNEFSLTKKLNEKYLRHEAEERSRFDSINARINILRNSSQTKTELYKVQIMEMQCERALKEGEQNLQEIHQSYDQQIWNQLHTYLKTYGKENNLDLLLGDPGNGSILFGNEKFEVTQPVIQFVNKSYENQ